MSSITQNKYKFTSRTIEYFLWGKHRSLPTGSLDLLTASDCPFERTKTTQFLVSWVPRPSEHLILTAPAWTAAAFAEHTELPNSAKQCRRGRCGRAAS